MPELPEVETVKRQLEESLINLRIKAVLVYLDKMVKVGPGRISSLKIGSKKSSIKFQESLKNKTVIAVARRAKYLVIKLSGHSNLLIHLRMSGQLIFILKKNLNNPLLLSLAKTAIKKTLPTKHTHVEFTFSSGDKLFYNDTRQFGHIRFATDIEVREVFHRHNLGPEPLSLKFREFQKILLSHANKRAKDFLLNQEVIAGIGNIYADESLFLSRINPLRKVGALKTGEARALLSAIQKVLKKAIAAGGSSLESFLMIDGGSGKFVDQHLVYAKGGLPCSNCKRLLKSQKIGSRTTTYCGYCQK